MRHKLRINPLSSLVCRIRGNTFRLDSHPTILLVALTIIDFLELSSFVLIPELVPTDVDAEQGVAAQPSITITGVNPLAITAEPGVFFSGSQTLSVSTTNYTGYTLRLETAGSTTDLTNTYGDTIPTISLPEGSDSLTSSAFESGYGYSTDGINYYPAPAVSGEGDEIGSTASANVSSDTYTLSFGVKPQTGVSAGTYTNAFRITATANDVGYVINYLPNAGTDSVSNMPSPNPQVGEISGTSFVLPETVPTRTDYSFLGWSTDSEATTAKYAAGSSVFLDPETSNVLTLYAIWQDVITSYTHEDPIVFDGTNYIDTGIQLFSAENWKKDFIFTATIDAMPTSYTNFDTLFSCMDESGEPYPGVVLRMNNKTTTQIVANVDTKTNGKTWTLKEGMEIVIKRVNKKVYYSYDGGTTFTYYADYEGFTGQFDETATIGASKKGDGTPWRYFSGTMSNITLELLDPTSYTVEYDLNGGTGTFEPQLMAPGMAEALRTGKPAKAGKMFDCWNTESDGSGTCYAAGETVTDLAQVGKTITLYAQWKEPIQYIIRFHDGLASDKTINQTLTYSYTENLQANTFTNGTSLFGVWNTAADGSGKYFVDEQEVSNLTETEGEVIDLYAVWGSEVFSQAGETVFDGTNYLDSGIQLFSEANAQKDFVAVLTITAKTYTNMGTIMNAMDETGSPWPGLVYRMNSSTRDDLIGNANNSTKKTIYNTTALGEQIVITRKDNIIYLKVGDEATQTGTNFTNLLRTFDVNTTFGAGDNGSGTMQRFFKGTMENIALVVLEADE